MKIARGSSWVLAGLLCSANAALAARQTPGGSDTDGDGLSDALEQELGSDPTQADRLVELTLPGGLVLLSGIPLQDKYDVWQRYTSLGCRQVDSRIGEEFVTYLLQKI